MTLVPNLSKLPIGTRAANKYDTFRQERERWLRACGNGGVFPKFKSWDSMNGADKRSALHDIATDVDGYVSPYTLTEADELLEMKLHSVEHLVARINVNGSDAGLAENDPNGFVLADRHANSRRGNLPLLLWPMEDELGSSTGSVSMPIPGHIVVIDGERHFVPPLSQRARLARKWLFLRASYSGVDSIAPPSEAQVKNKNLIIAFCKSQPLLPYELQMNRAYRARFGWANPLLERDAHVWYDSRAWRDMCF